MSFARRSTPSSVSRSSSSETRRSRSSNRHRERVEQILKGGEHLLRLIDDILDLSRIEAGGVSISTEPVNVAEVLDDGAHTLEPMAAREGIALEMSLAAGTTSLIRRRPHAVRANPDEFRLERDQVQPAGRTG